MLRTVRDPRKIDKIGDFEFFGTTVLRSGT